jgi:hypothetical protein
MAVIRATHTPDGYPPAGGGPQPVRYATSALWPGITTGHDARCSCTWARWHGTYQVKFRDAMCVNHPRGYP